MLISNFCCCLSIVLVLLFHSDFVNSRTSDELKVTLPNYGTLVGRYLVSHDGHGMRAFLGVPYAEPPVGELRFKEPQPKQPWHDVRQATEDSPMCVQRDPFRRDYEIEGSEDCLYLATYTPIKSITNESLPVMVFFHGGGWQCGAGVSTFYGPDYLMDHEIVLVVANYRLGPLGFLSTGQDDCPGNNGLKDQVAVLRWIQENIKEFGGNPDRVTIFGESAGGASGTYHMMSPLSKGLFQQVISQSGTNLDPWAQPAHKDVAPKRAATLGAMLGCPKNNNDWKSMVACLRLVSAEKITETFYEFFEWDTDPMIPFPPVIEHEHDGAFITKHPRDEPAPWALNLPWITGITLDEGAIKSAAFLNTPQLWDDLNSKWDTALPIALNYNHHKPEKQQEITKKINEYYFNNHNQLTDATRDNLTNLFTDGWFLSGMDEYLKIRLFNDVKMKKSSNPVADDGSKNVGSTYVYLFAHKGASSFTEIFNGGRENYYGVCHAEELQYLFPMDKVLFVSSVPTEECKQMRQALTKMWVNFAYTGNPSADGLPEWLPTNQFPFDYLRIGAKDYSQGIPIIAMEKGLLNDRANFWYDIGAHLPRDHDRKMYSLKDEL